MTHHSQTSPDRFLRNARSLTTFHGGAMTQAARRILGAAACLALAAVSLGFAMSSTPAAAADHATLQISGTTRGGEFTPDALPLELRGAGPGTLALRGANSFSQLPTAPGGGSCTFTVLPNDNSTSGNERCPTLRNRFGRSVYLITAAELAANGLQNGSSVTR